MLNVPVDGRFANRPYIMRSRIQRISYDVIERNDENPRGWGQGVCNTPLHLPTQYTDFVSPLLFSVFVQRASVVDAFLFSL